MSIMVWWVKFYLFLGHCYDDMYGGCQKYQPWLITTMVRIQQTRRSGVRDMGAQIWDPCVDAVPWAQVMTCWGLSESIPVLARF